MNSILGSVVLIIILSFAGSVVGNNDTEIMTLLRSIQSKLDGFENNLQALEQTMTNEIRNKTCTVVETEKLGNFATVSDLQNLSTKIDRYRDQVQNCSRKIKCDLHFNQADSVNISPKSTTPNNQSLKKAVILTTKLPSKTQRQGLLYDGDDTIYLLGGIGHTSHLSDQILLFSLSSQNMSRIGSLPEPSWSGLVQWDKDHKNIFYFGGGDDSDQVYKFDPKTKTGSKVGQLPYDVMFGTSFKYNETSNTVYIFGGKHQGKELLTFDIGSLTWNKMANLSTSTFGAASVCVGKKVWIYGPHSSRGAESLLELNLDTFAMRSVGGPDHPEMLGFSSSIWDGSQFVYSFGGYKPTASFPTDGITQFDPKTAKSRFIPVENFPVGQGMNSSFYGAAPDCIFVNKLNRIYCFGGEKSGPAFKREFFDDIFYIDLLN